MMPRSLLSQRPQHCMNVRISVDGKTPQRLRSGDHLMRRYDFLVQWKAKLSQRPARTMSEYEFQIDSVTQRQTYQVEVPLWKGQGDEKKDEGLKVKAPMQPHFHPGFVYVPHYKNERVLLHMYYDRSAITSSLEWAPGVQPPQDTLGQGLIFGKNTASQTGVTHVYEDEKPKFIVSRNDEGDPQTITPHREYAYSKSSRMQTTKKQRKTDGHKSGPESDHASLGCMGHKTLRAV